MDTVKNAANYVSETVQEYTSAAQKEGNKSVAKDSNQSIGDRVSAGASALGNSAEEQGHSASAFGNKEAAKN